MIWQDEWGTVIIVAEHVGTTAEQRGLMWVNQDENSEGTESHESDDRRRLRSTLAGEGNHSPAAYCHSIWAVTGKNMYCTPPATVAVIVQCYHFSIIQTYIHFSDHTAGVFFRLRDKQTAC